MESLAPSWKIYRVEGAEVFYGTQYHPVPPVEKDSYVI
jgi:hypothetical protein